MDEGAMKIVRGKLGKRFQFAGVGASIHFFKGEKVNSLRAKLTTPLSSASVTPSEAPKIG